MLRSFISGVLSILLARCLINQYEITNVIAYSTKKTLQNRAISSAVADLDSADLLFSIKPTRLVSSP